MSGSAGKGGGISKYADVFPDQSGLTGAGKKTTIQDVKKAVLGTSLPRAQGSAPLAPGLDQLNWADDVDADTNVYPDPRIPAIDPDPSTGHAVSLDDVLIQLREMRGELNRLTRMITEIHGWLHAQRVNPSNYGGSEVNKVITFAPPPE